MAAEFATLAKRFQNILRKGTGIMNEKKLLSTAEAAEVLGVAHSTLRSYIMQGLLPAVKVGSTYVVDVDDLARFEKPKMGRPRNDPEI